VIWPTMPNGWPTTRPISNPLDDIYPGPGTVHIFKILVRFF